MTSLILGTVLAMAAVSYVLFPLFFGKPAEEADVGRGPAASETARHLAIEALQEIELDRATGKLSDSDYAALKASYTKGAIESVQSDSIAP